MLSMLESILLSVATSEAMLGILGNIFIVLVNCTNWVRNKKLSKINFILTGLAISRVFTIWIITLDAYTKVFFLTTLMPSNLHECISYIWVIINHLSVWFATSLSIFYFLKIANFSHYIFLWLKRRADKVFVFLIGYLIITWLASFPLAVTVIKNIKVHHNNTSWLIQLEKRELLINYVFANMGPISLFMVAVFTCFLLTISLWRHRRRMQSTGSKFRDLNTEVHVKAMKVLISFIILFILYFMGVLIETLCLFLTENILLFIFGFTLSSTYPCCHSFILILTSRELKQASMRALQRLKCCET
ncbi:taste receptor type 2 member 104 [Rattus norvegicus]|uniref:Taste receptor type 2 member 104 n=1 Tax=Rattus norvegicus TaxID=10116 RepID=TR104_RAT|nr:taste receptor type 2 member 104 [Rattus norvegicus]Q67ES9.1 RecName: Full=Taste receptor type 2 member 104; Short=T2R104; AltName: Full=Taste receptor type 2 member 21; Short=T2R21 [Rattus norvegicus]AAR13350.1 putative taste receptor T2R21 [Rattus norvegicus]|eukprot:NP_001160153.1 taste receptor type 2 member 104 [Rattus norvegicus]